MRHQLNKIAIHTSRRHETNKLIINRQKLKTGIQKLNLELNKEDLEIENLNFIGPIILDCELNKNQDTVILSGIISYRLNLCCVNCLKNFERDFKEKIYQEYIKISRPIKFNAQLEEEDFIREYHSTDYFDIKPLIRDTIILSVPIAFWCRTDCKGVL
ncbi:MAG: DUF177 domain-containing protein [candidate division WOR-3 bacterium]